MCKSLADGGGRCYSYLKNELTKVSERSIEAQNRGDIDSYFTAQEEYKSLLVQADSTKTGQNKLKEQIAETGDPDGTLTARLNIAENTIDSDKEQRKSKKKLSKDIVCSAMHEEEPQEKISDIVAQLRLSFPEKKEKMKDKGSEMHKNILNKYRNLCQKNETEEDLVGYIDISRSAESRAGNFLEKGFSVAVNSKLPPSAKHFIGKDIEHEISAYRTAVNKDFIQEGDIGIANSSTANEKLKKESIEKLHKEYHLNKQWTEKMLTPKKTERLANGKIKHHYQELTLPDSITIFTNANNEKEIRIGEAKLSGELDSKNLPANIAKLMAKGPYDDIPNTKVERAILLTGTKADLKGEFPKASEWSNSIKKQNVNLSVKSSHNAFEWASGYKMSHEEYKKDVLGEVENFAAESIYKRLHG